MKNYFDRWLAWQGNPRLKIGDVKEKDADTVVIDIGDVTQVIMQANGTPYVVATDEPADSLPVLEMCGPVLVFGGCYSNFEATTALCAAVANPFALEV